MSKNRTPKHSTETPAEKSDLAVLDREDERKHARCRPSPIEPRDWRGEGVVGDIHTD
jgi:hypothetical protein